MAVAKKQKKEEAGAPAWMVTYGDMVTLLLTFFVLLLSMSELKKEEKLMEFMEVIREAFGYRGGFRQSPIEQAVLQPKNVTLREMLIIPTNTEDFSKSDDAGRRGMRDKVKPIRPAERFVLGAPVQFDELSADLRIEERDAIAAFADQIRGFHTQIEIRGHCSARPVDGTAFASHTDLAFQRARRVQQALIDAGIEADRLVVIAAGTNEPLAKGAYRPQERVRNDIVELIQLNLAAK